MDLKNLEVIMMSPEELVPYKNNPRINDEAADAVAKSIQEFGFKYPILVDKNMVIISGHTRQKAAKKLGLKQVPVMIAKDLTEAQAQSLRLVDNKTGELAEWDIEKLTEEIQEAMKEFDMDAFGFDLDALTVDVNDLEEAELEDDPEEVPEPITKEGEIWQLGPHRLMVGDSTNPEDVKKLMDGKKADLVVTDPPYNVDYTGGTDEALKIKNDSMSDSSFVEFLFHAFKNMKDELKPGGVFYIWHADSNRLQFLQAMEKAELELRQVLIWVKDSLVLGRQDYNWKHEPCLYGWTEGAAHYYCEDYTQTTIIEDMPNINAMDKDQLKDYIKELQSIIDHNTTVIHLDRPMANVEHPTMKPVKLFARQIVNSTRRGEIVLDLFAGSGTAIIAADQLDRIAYCMEYDPKYADAIIRRYQKLTGEEAQKIS